MRYVDRTVVESVIWWPVFVVTWLATLTAVTAQELLAAALFAVPCAVLAPRLRRLVRGRWCPPAELPQLAAATLPAVASDTVGALRLATGRRPPTGRFEPIPLPAEPDAARRDGREAFTTLLVTSTPGAMVVHADRRRLITHTLPVRRTRLHRMLRSAGIR
ncbi:Na+/H+ antiporter subunit E [Nocardia sp. BMG111209]|uniref:Na+/H+ antiporter subunit E n=1 Tax=Nocardia sp. BMG111209 TaxID=1160137 RepID=UPI000369C2D9|nr:Na+/H+ antiporter subunit E [Nocardia sp. BMG111209]